MESENHDKNQDAAAMSVGVTMARVSPEQITQMTPHLDRTRDAAFGDEAVASGRLVGLEAAGYFLDELFRTDPHYPVMPPDFLFAGREVAGTESNNSILLLEPKDVPSVNEYLAGLDDDFVPRAREAQAGPHSPYFRPDKPVRGFATLEAELIPFCLDD